MIPVISIVGKSDAGKTTLVERLIRELKRRGYRVASIKHHIHDFDIDKPGKDSWRHAQAGSDIVVVAAPHQVAFMHKLGEELSLNHIVQMLDGVDIVLTEGFKSGDKPKIEVSRSERSHELLCTPEELVAIATDEPYDLPVPQFSLEDATGLVDLLESRFLHR